MSTDYESLREGTLRRERALASEIGERAKSYCPELLEVPGIASITAGKLIGEIAGANRFRSDAQLAHFAGCAPIPASSGRRLLSNRDDPGPSSPRRPGLSRPQASRGKVERRSAPLLEAPLGSGRLADTQNWR